MKPLSFPPAPPQPRPEPIVVQLPTVLLEQMGNYLGAMPWKLVHHLRPNLIMVLSNQPGKDEVQIDKALLDSVLALLVEQPYDQVNSLMYLINSWIKYSNAQVPHPQ